MRISGRSFNNIYYYFFPFFCFFPYVFPIGIGTDLQPYAFLFASIIFIINRTHIPKELLPIFLVSMYSLLLLVIDGVTMSALRSTFNYVSVSFISVATFFLLKRNKVDVSKLLYYSAIIMMVIGSIQLFFDKNFLTMLVSSSRTTLDRGVTGLAPEPTFYAIVFIFYSLIAYFIGGKYRNRILVMSLLSIVLLAKSSMGILFVILYLILYLIFQFHHHQWYRPKILVVLLFLLIGTVLLFPLLDPNRFTTVFQLILDNPGSVYMLDASIHDRFFHVYFSMVGAANNYLLPGMFSNWGKDLIELVRLSDSAIPEWISFGDRIMSGYGAAFFELGILGGVYVATTTFLLYKIYKQKISYFILHAIFINLIMFSAIQLALPLFGFYLGVLVHMVHLKNAN